MINTPTSYDAAKKILKEKPVMSRSAFDRLAPEVKPYAFCISGVENAQMLQDIRDICADVAKTPHSRNWDDAKKEIAERLSSLPNFDDNKANRRAELLLRTHGYEALRVGQWELAQEMKSILPYFKYLCTQDGKTRTSHRALHGLVLPVDHPFWDKHMPPGWDWGCRCQVVQIHEIDKQAQQEAEKKIPYERRRVLDEKQQKLLADNNEIWVSPSEKIGITSSKESNCKSLYMDADAILKKFDSTAREIFLKNLESVPVSGIDNVSNAKEWFLRQTKQSTVSDIKTVYSYIEDIGEIEDAFDVILKTATDSDSDAIENALKILELPEEKRGTFKIGNVKHVGGKKAELDTLSRGKAELERFVNRKFYDDIPALDVVFSKSERSPRSGLSSRWDSNLKRLRSDFVTFQYGTPKYTGPRTLEGILNEKTFTHEFIHHLESENPELLRRSVDFVLKRSGGKPPKRLKDIYPTSGYHFREKTYEDDYVAKGGNAYSGKEYKFGDEWVATDVLTMGAERLLTNPLKFYRQDKEYFEFTVAQLRGAFL